eukprot:767314-Hanusia_phi.AAC.3
MKPPTSPVLSAVNSATGRAGAGSVLPGSPAPSGLASATSKLQMVGNGNAGGGGGGAGGGDDLLWKMFSAPSSSYSGHGGNKNAEQDASTLSEGSTVSSGLVLSGSATSEMSAATGGGSGPNLGALDPQAALPKGVGTGEEGEKVCPHAHSRERRRSGGLDRHVSADQGSDQGEDGCSAR